MQKTISINIGNIIFHINEDAYDQLKSYLGSINKYFSSYADSKEIIADIEGRIAEKFTLKLNNGKQNINAQDVDDLIADMGTVDDFKASMDEEEKLQEEAKNNSQEEAEIESSEDSTEPEQKRLYRDGQRSIIGGVASGLAHYINADPIWIRLFFVLTIFNSVFFNIDYISSFGALAYIILWVAMPINNNLKENKKIKKFFRDEDNKVLGGVCSGIANYFGIDPAIVRIIGAVFIPFYGIIILIYFILWAIIPAAKSITEKMEMKGKPVTLNNIETSIKKSLNVEEKEESALTKILLLPFRLISIVIGSLGKLVVPILKALFESLRVVIGSVMIIVGFVSIIALTMTLFGYFSGIEFFTEFIHLGTFTANEMIQSFNGLSMISVYFLVTVPAFGLIVLGLYLITKKKHMNTGVGIALLSLWVLSILGAMFSVPNVYKSFKYEDEIVQQEVFPMENKSDTLMLKVNELGNYYNNNLSLTIKPHADSANYLVETKITSKGKSKTMARKNAEEINYEITQYEQALIFDNRFSRENAPFRLQEVDVTLYVPYGKVFKMDKDIRRILENTLWKGGYKGKDIKGNYWVFDENGIKCTSCKDEPKKWKKTSTHNFKDFDALQIGSLFKFQIEQGDDYQVKIKEDDDIANDVYFEQNGKNLRIRFKNNDDWWKKSIENEDRIHLSITMPHLKFIEVTGNCDGKIRDFKEDEMTIKLAGVSNLKAYNITSNKLNAEISGASNLKLIGSTDELKAKAVGSSSLKAFDLKAKKVEANTLGASSAFVYAYDKLWAKASGVSSIKYKGKATVTKDENGLGNVERD